MTHLIHRLNLEFNSASVDAPFARLQEVERWAQEVLVSALERQAESWPQFEGEVQIDELNVELNLKGWEDWETQLSSELQRRLPAALRDNIDFSRSEDRGALRSANAPHSPTSGHRGEASADGLFRALHYYLRHGQLPWFFAHRSTNFRDKIVSYLLDAAPEVWTDTLSLLRISAAAPRRLLALFGPDELPLLVRRLFPRFSAALLHMQEEWSRQGPPPSVSSKLQGSSEQRTRLLSLLVLEELAQGSAALPSLGNGSDEEGMVVRSVLARLKEEHGLPLDSLPPPLSEALGRGSPEPASEAPRPSTVSNSAPPRTAPPREAEHFVDSAGIVLLAPYLPTFLTRLGLSSGTSIHKPAEALVAVHHLATGSLEAPQEFQLALGQILCGLDEQDLPLLESPSEAIVLESEKLLSSLIEHWSALKQTSVTGLRQSFLLRSGKLSRGPFGEDLLQVEPKAYDILLSFVPWTFRTIRLPWMRRTLRTEWGN